MRLIHAALFFSLTTTLFTACPLDDKGDSEGPDGSSTSSDPTTGATDGEVSSTTGAPGEESTGEANATTGGMSGSTTGEDSACASQCANLAACAGAPSPECVEDCEHTGDVYAYSGAACRALYDEYTVCMGAATCDELADFSACQQYADAMVAEACTIPSCRALCDQQIACGLAEAGTEVACAFECTTASAWAAVELGEQCAEASATMSECYAALSCAQLEEGVGCEAESEAQQLACQ